jgi:predicted LPLAT superfamily acyltransferase
MSTEWRDIPEAGSATAIRFMVWVARVLGRRVLHLILLPVAVYFFLVRKAERRASRAYLSRVLGRAPTASEVFRHFLTFAQVIADRYYSLTDNTDDIPIRVHGAEKLQALVDLGKGGIVLSAHLGSFEAARVLGTRLSGVVLRMVLDVDVNRNLIAGLESVNPGFRDAVISLNQPPASLALSISESLQAGEWIGLLSDRSVRKDRTVSVDFLGAPAQFPVGPCVIAGMFKVPLVCVFPLYVNGGYEVFCEILSAEAEVPRASRAAALQAYVEQFVTLLEKHVCSAPYNWFNFYDFWKSNDREGQ